MTVAIMSVKTQRWSILNTLFFSRKDVPTDTDNLETFLDSRLNKELLPFISAAF